MISADEDNPSSWKTIESCGGLLDRVITKEGKPLKVYRIDLSVPKIMKKSLSGKALQKNLKVEKAKIKIEKKAKFRAKTEKKLVEKSERKIAHKKANAQKKFEAKKQKRIIPKI